MSESESLPLYGRKWKATIGVADDKGIVIGSDSFNPEPLRCTFRIEKIGFQAYYYAEIVLYNLTAETTNQIVKEGTKVIVEAGYQNGNYGKIFDGFVFQPMIDRENVVDFKLTLNCVNQMKILENNLVKFTANAGLDPRTQIKNIAAQSKTPIETGTISDNLDGTALPRGKVYFGEPKKYFRQIANGSNAQWFIDENKLHFSKISDPPSGQAIVYTPKTGLIGTPQQTDYGVSFTVLLDPRLKIANPAITVKLDQSLIRQQKAQIGQITSILDKDGMYKVIGVTHIGDTRGNEWYTEVTGVTTLGKVPAQLIGTGGAQTIDLPEMQSTPKDSVN